jgi:hypothetical protein
MPERTDPESAPLVSRRFRRWIPFGVVFFLIAVTVAVDARLKTSNVIGFAPPDAGWLIATDDFGAFWKGVERSDVMAALAGDVPHPLSRLAVQAGDTLGIRPTPRHWNLWLGPKLTGWTRDTSFGICAKPGLLLRLAHLFHASSRTTYQDLSVYTYKNFFYTWRQGFVIAATTPDDLTATVEVTAARVGRADQPGEVRLATHVPEEVLLRVRGADGLPVSGSVRLSFFGGEGRLETPGAWPTPPACFMAAADGRDLVVLLRAIGAKTAELPGMELPRRFAVELIRQWGVPDLETLALFVPGEQSVGIAGFDLSVFPPLPVMACLMRPEKPPEGLHPWAELLPPDVIPFEWADRPGVLTPWLSEKMTLCLGRTETFWVATTQEPLMADFALHAVETPHVEADAMVYLDWDRVGQMTEALLQQLEQLELLRTSSSGGYAPYADRLRRLGVLEITGQARDDRLSFEGYLAQQGRRP